MWFYLIENTFFSKNILFSKKTKIEHLSLNLHEYDYISINHHKFAYRNHRFTLYSSHYTMTQDVTFFLI